jgi:putative endonuclease
MSKLNLKKLSPRKVKSYKFGRFAEFIATLYLRLKFYKIITKNYKTKSGEIDIIAYKANTLVAIEVKARKNLHKNLNIEEILTNYQTIRIKNTICYFLHLNQRYKDCLIRFDLILVDRFFIIKHFKNYW